MREKPEDFKAYLGDGAYATFHGHDVEIWCNRDNGRNYVHLDPSAVQHLLNFLREAGWRIK
jgi:hypothetical protein